MKQLFAILVLASAAVVTACSSMPPTPPKPSLARFQIQVTPSSTGFTATCTVGCAWTSLTWRCDSTSGEACRADVNQMGVGAPR